MRSKKNTWYLSVLAVASLLIPLITQAAQPEYYDEAQFTIVAPSAAKEKFGDWCYSLTHSWDSAAQINEWDYGDFVARLTYLNAGNVCFYGRGPRFTDFMEAWTGLPTGTKADVLIFDAPINAWGADFITASPYFGDSGSDGLTISLIDSSTGTTVHIGRVGIPADQCLSGEPLGPCTDNTFFGFVSETPFDKVMIRPYGGTLAEFYHLDNMYYGSVATADTTAPVVSNVNADDVVFPSDAVVTALAEDTESNIKSAEYSRDGLPGVAMSAADGSFDEQAENLTATLSGLLVKTYEVCVTATDVNDNTSDGTACDTFEVTAAQLAVAFAGPELDLDGAPTELEAEVTGPCASGAEVEFFADLGSGYVSQGKANADLSGVATKSVNLPDGGIYDIKVVVGDQNLGGDDAAECLGDEDTSGITVVADPKASSTGGGWYKIDGLSPPRVNFGYTAQSKYNKKLDEYSTKGNLVWMHQEQYRLKGVITEGGKLPEEMCDSEFAACAAFGGEGTLYEHNPNYDPGCPSYLTCGQEWINGIANTPFVIFVNDGGTSRECLNKKKCKEVEKPDQFGIQIDYESIPAESDPLYLNGGNLVVR